MPSPQQDLLHVLAREHRDHSATFHELMEHPERATPRHRRRQFASLVLHLGVHLMAERLLVHPLVVPVVLRGEEFLRDRDHESTLIQELLMSTGAQLGDGEPLNVTLRAVSAEFTAHADREELEVFLHARHAASPQRLRRTGRLHVVLQQRLPARYQREAPTRSEPWNDPGLFDTLAAWYAADVPRDEQGPAAADGTAP